MSMTLSERAYFAIRDLIVRLELAPGDVIREDALQDRLGIGRTPIREALQRLARDQFVTVIPRRGMLVSGVDVTELSMLYETRTILEPYATRLACARGRAEHWEAMAAAIDAARGDFPEVTKPDSMVAAMVAIDEAFDRIRMVEKNGWKVPADHPDLAPAADAGKVADLLRLLENDAHVEKLDGSARSEFRALLERNARQASDLEELLIGKDGTDEARLAKLGPAMKGLAAGCKECHVRYRD